MTIDGLKEFGLTEMSGGEIRTFLSNRGYGVLGLPTGGAPYTIPMSFGYDGGDRLSLAFFVADRSRKLDLSAGSDAASFLVFEADSVFSWESVYLTGAIEEVPAESGPDREAAPENAWRLALFERAGTTGELVPFEFRIEEQTGVRSVELPPGFDQAFDREFDR